MTDEPRTIRDARLALRTLERGVDSVRMAPAMAQVGFAPSYYLRRAQAALRQAERALARSDDPRLSALKSLAPQVERSRAPSERRKRYRCAGCFAEALQTDADIESRPYHVRMRKTDDGRERFRCGKWQVVPPLRHRKNQA